jgi:hypothetical protein
VFLITILKARELFCKCSGSYKFGFTDYSERVGTSNNGVSAFGASINVISKSLKINFISRRMTVTDLSILTNIQQS